MFVKPLSGHNMITSHLRSARIHSIQTRNLLKKEGETDRYYNNSRHSTDIIEVHFTLHRICQFIFCLLLVVWIERFKFFNTPTMAKSKKGKTAAAAKNGGIGKKSLTKTASTSTINDTSATKVTTTTTVTSPISPPTSSSIHLYDIAFYVFILVSFMYATIYAYNIRLHAIREYGPVIHEFDPYFNYRATEVRRWHACMISTVCVCVCVLSM